MSNKIEFENVPCKIIRADNHILCPNCNENLNNRMESCNIITCDSCNSVYRIQFDVATYIEFYKVKKPQFEQLDLLDSINE